MLLRLLLILITPIWALCKLVLEVNWVIFIISFMVCFLILLFADKIHTHHITLSGLLYILIANSLLQMYFVFPISEKRKKLIQQYKL